MLIRITSRSSPCTFSRFLTKKGSSGCPAKNSSHGGIPAAQNVDLVFDAARLHVAEGRDAEGPARRLAGVLHHGQRDRLRLGGVDARRW